MSNSTKSIDLPDIEKWFQTAIMHPGGAEKGVQSGSAQSHVADRALQDIVLPSIALRSIDRLSIYANMYFDRLIDILATEFPSVRHLLGPTEFSEVGKEYVTTHPSTDYSLAAFGAGFPQFLFEESECFSGNYRGFAAAIASVERSMEVVFDAQEVDAISSEALQSIEPHHWDRVRFRPIPALRLLRLDYPVNDYINSVREGDEAIVPEAKPAFVVIYRQNYRVWRIDVNEQQFALLNELQAGCTLGESLAVCAEQPGSDIEGLATSVFEWFRNWTAEGFFQAVSVDE